MAATKLSQYNEALRLIGDVRLVGLDDEVEARYALDAAWDGATAFVLRQAGWKFALKEDALFPGGTPLTGYKTSYQKPQGWLRTQALFIQSAEDGAGGECPVDIREQGINFSSNEPPDEVQIRFISADFTDPELAYHPWPEHFAKLHAAYLAFSVATRINASSGEAARLSQLFASLLPEALMHDAVPENPWLRFQLDGRFQRGANIVAQLEHWRFALKTVTISAGLRGGVPIDGYLYSFPVPTDWVCSQALYIARDGRECPFDLREHENHWSTNILDFTARYTSATKAFDPAEWPDLVKRAVLAYLEFEESGEELGQPGYTPPATKAGATKAALWQSALSAARDQEAVADSPFFQGQIDGSFLRAAQQTLAAGYFRHSLKEASFTAESVLTQSGTPGVSYPYRYARPEDWLKTHAAFVPFDGRECPFDLREDSGEEGALQWSTACPHFAVRYVSSTLGLDSTRWGALFRKAVLACLDYEEDAEPPEEAEKAAAGAAPAQAAAGMWQKALADALAAESEAEDQWWRFQRNGRWLSAAHHVIEQGRWRFCIETVELVAGLTLNADGTTTGNVVDTPLGPGTISPGYSARFRKPNDWLRTIRLYRQIGPGGLGGPIGSIDLGSSSDRVDIDFRDEGGAFHANWTPVKLRYLTRGGLDATRWTTMFRNAVLAFLEYEECRGEPKLAAVSSAKLKFFEEAVGSAEAKDDASERPRINQTGRFVRGRFGRSGGGYDPALKGGGMQW